MKKFAGLPTGKVRFTRIPEPFFSELLPQIDDLNELKLTLYALWRLDRMEGGFRYLTEADIREDSVFVNGLAATPEESAALLKSALNQSVERGTFLKAELPRGEENICLYFFNSPKGRAAVQSIQAGEWRPSADASIPVELTPAIPNIYHLYEENIGPMTPLLAETLQDAEDTYPPQWIKEAFRIAVEKNVRNWRYVEAILRRWQERGYDAPEARRDTEKSRRQYSAWEED